MTHPKTGDRITVYKDPNTQLIVEGLATLIKRYVDWGCGRSVWIVKFNDNPDMLEFRVINRKPKIKKE